MNKNINLKDIKTQLKSIKHPAINSSLYDLGIIKNIEIKENKVVVLLAFPFPNIPIKDILIDKVKKVLIDLNFNVEIKTTIMDENELQKFTSLEQDNWRE